jgi:hypothetical protein
MEMLKKYYRNRYHSFLQTIIEQNKKREQELELIKQKEEKRKAKLKENLGVDKVQSKFMEELAKPRDEKVIEEIPKKPVKEKPPKRGSSVAGMKTMTSSSNLYNTTL